MRPQQNRKSSGWICLFCLLACPQLSAEPSEQQNDNENVPKRTEIHFDDLQKKYRIIGRLGKPVGEFHTIHGTWKRFDFSTKQLYLLITHIDHQCLSDPLLLPEKQLVKCGSDIYTSKLEIDPLTSSYWKQRDLLCCEYRVFEKIGFTGLPNEYWKEVGKQTRLELYYAKENQQSLNHPFQLSSTLFYVQSKFVKVSDLPQVSESLHQSDELHKKADDKRKQASQQKEQALIDISFSDLRDRYQIIGRLGKPIGEYSKIRGVWKRERVIRDRSPVRIMRFYITHIDGRSLKVRLDFDQRDGIFTRFSLEPFAAPEPHPEEFEIWELRVVESMGYAGLAKGYNSEIGYPGCLELNKIPDFKLISFLRYHRHPSIIRGEGFKRVLKP